jgi:peptidoglycan/LPS O-acetylase OafA/YrhL
MLVDALKNSSKDMKLIWAIVIIFTQIIGALIYYFVEKRPRNKVKIEKMEHKNEEKKEEK